MTITGLLPATLDSQSYTDDISAGPVDYIATFGFRTAVAIVATGVDIWTGAATLIPIPPLAGQQMSVISTSAQDGVAGTGILTIEIHYIDANGIAKEETVTMNGVAAVNTAALNIRFINDFYALTAGATKAAVGTITIFPVGVPGTIYTQIDIGKTRHINTARMVPKDKVLLIESFDASGASAVGAQSVDVRLRITAHHGILIPVTPPNTVFISEDSILVFNSSESANYATPIVAPSLAIIKISAFALVAGQDIQSSWHGKLVSAP